MSKFWRQDRRACRKAKGRGDRECKWGACVSCTLEVLGWWLNPKKDLSKGDQHPTVNRQVSASAKKRSLNGFDIPGPFNVFMCPSRQSKLQESIIAVKDTGQWGKGKCFPLRNYEQDSGWRYGHSSTCARRGRTNRGYCGGFSGQHGQHQPQASLCQRSGERGVTGRERRRLTATRPRTCCRANSPPDHFIFSFGHFGPE